MQTRAAMGAPQNQTISPSHNSNMQQLLNQVKDGLDLLIDKWTTSRESKSSKWILTQ